MGGGIFSLCISRAFCLWREMYLGHLVKRVRSLLAQSLLVLPEASVGLFSKRGLVGFASFLPPLEAAPEAERRAAGVGAAFLPFPTFLPLPACNGEEH